MNGSSNFLPTASVDSLALNHLLGSLINQRMSISLVFPLHLGFKVILPLHVLLSTWLLKHSIHGNQTLQTSLRLIAVVY